MEFSAHCTVCGSDVGVEAIHFDTSWQITIIKLTCGHTIQVKNVFTFLTRKDLDELFPPTPKDGIYSMGVV